MNPQKMTTAEYQAKFGSIPGAGTAQQTPETTTPAPVQMTREQYNATYGKPAVATPEAVAPAPKPSFFSKFKSDIVAPIAGAAYGLTKPGQTIQKLASKGVDKLFGTKGFGAPSGAEGFAGALGLDANTPQFKAGAMAGELGTYMAPGSQVSKLTKGAGTVAKAVASGLTDAGVQAANAGEVNRQTLYAGLTAGVSTGVFDTIGKVLSKSGEAIQNSVIKPSQADISDGFSMKTIQKYNLGGSLQTTHQRTEEAMTKISQELNEKLATSKTKVDLNAIFEATSKRLQGDRLKTFGTNSGVGTALDALKGEIDNVGANVSIPEAQLIKRASGQYGAWSFGRPDADAPKQAVYNVFYNEMKNSIEKLSPEGVRELNMQLSELIPVQNAVIRRIPIADRNMPISLTDIIALSSSAVDPSALGVFGISRLQKSGAAADAIFKGGESLRRNSVGLGLGVGFTTNRIIDQANNQE